MIINKLSIDIAIEKLAVEMEIASAQFDAAKVAEIAEIVKRLRAVKDAN